MSHIDWSVLNAMKKMQWV